MANNSIWQNLGDMLNVYPKQDINNTKEKIIIRGNTPEDVKRKALELEQQREIVKKFNNLTDHGFQKAMQYEAARLPAYLDYEGMEYMPIIASALDLFMEEATTIGTDGKMLRVNSDKERIKEHLEEFFYDTINVNVNLPLWARNLCKYGDNFVYMLGEKKKGVTHVKQLVNYEMERIERVNKGRADVRFKQRETSQEFNPFEIAHFRLLGDDKYLPYGSSILNKVRRVFRQLVMAEDAMLTYRITRAGEKRIFKIDVGNIDEDDIEEYVQKTMARFKKQQQVYPDSGQIDYRFNILGNDEDYVIPVRNQNVQTGIDTLPGAQNLDAIHDIEYLRDNLFTGLGTPKPFLGFQDAAGDGKNMAQMDVRFAKKVNRIQQALIQELNKMAMVHLYLLGFDKDFSNFSLSLTNPSTQQEILMAEMMQQKAQVYTEITRSEGGIAAMSHTNAKRMLFGMSDIEIANDLKMQRMERAISQELQDSPLVITKTGMFDDVDDKYGSGEVPVDGLEGGEEGEGVAEPNEPPIGGEGDPNAPQSPSELPPVESKKTSKPKLSEKDYDNQISGILNVGKKSNDESSKDKDKSIINENKKKVDQLNEKALNMTREIDDFIKKQDGESINKKEKLDENLFNGENLQKIVDDLLNGKTNNDE